MTAASWPTRRSGDSVLRRLREQRGAMVALIVLAVITLACVLSPLLPFDGTTSNLGERWLPPSAAHPLGTDDLGRDFLQRVLESGRVSLFVGFAAALASTAIGVIVGLAAGYYGRAVDEVLMRVVDFLSAVPWMVLVIVASAFLSPGLWTIIIIIGTLSWMPTARLVRAEALSTRERVFVDYADYIGVRSFVVIVRHVLPAAVPTLVVAATATVSAAMMTESALSFLGLGIQPPLSSWGSLLTIAQGSLQRAPLLAVVPGLFIAVTVFCVNVLGNGVRAAVTREGGR